MPGKLMSQPLRRLWRRGRGLLLRTRLGRWAQIIHRVRAEYYRFYGRTPALLRPRRFTEKMQWRKLFELDPKFALMSDKLAARDFVTARIGPARRADLLWVGSDPDAIPFDRLVPPYILKPSHASGRVLIVRDTATLDMAAARATAREWLTYCHGTVTNEPGYLHVPRRLFIERLLLRADGSLPLEHRVFVFDGRAAFIRTVTSDALGRPHQAEFRAPDWTDLPFAWWGPMPHPMPLPRPPRLAEILSISERIGAGFSHCRVDIFDCDDELMMSEVTLYSSSGLIPYKDPAYDFVMGACWTIDRPILRALWAIAIRRWDIRPPRR